VVRSRAVSRLIGFVTVLAGLGFVAWSWHDAPARFFSFKMAATGPFLVGCGLWVAIEGPEFPLQRVSALGWVLMLLGLGVGLLYGEFLATGRLPFLR
jgi:protein-S-isoprenylcysteine O-methyltransferase Ste14